MSTEKMRSFIFYASDDIYVCKCMTFRIFIAAITCKLIRVKSLLMCYCDLVSVSYWLLSDHQVDRYRFESYVITFLYYYSVFYVFYNLVLEIMWSNVVLIHNPFYVSKLVMRCKLYIYVFITHVGI
jgi:hypothetical protein